MRTPRARCDKVPAWPKRPSVLTGSLLLLLLAACVPDHRYDPAPASPKVTRADLVGKWAGWGGSSLRLAGDGKASAVDLDGQDWDFAYDWRFTGSGTWRLLKAEDVGGQRAVHSAWQVEVSLTRPGNAPDSSDSDPNPSSLVDNKNADPKKRTRPAPKTYRWVLGVSGTSGNPKLYFQTGDPDSGQYYEMRRPSGTSPAASPSSPASETP